MKAFMDELGGELLASVSRSFYLSIRFLPAALRPPITLAYLLARTSDTIADETNAPVPVRLKHLRAFRDALETGAPLEGLREIAPAHAGERLLIGKAGRCLEWLAACDPADRSEIRSVLQKIIRGQTLDLERFGDSTHPASLQTAAQLDEYTYLVAGCVGEFWTRLCFLHDADYSRRGIAEMCALGINFGKGLQLVNILRDMPADKKAGRCYLPQELPAREHWLGVARGHLDDALLYIENVADVRVRFACILPWHLGMRTLALLVREGASDRRVKVCRAEVYAAMVLAFFAAFSNPLLRGMRSLVEAAVPAACGQNYRI